MSKINILEAKSTLSRLVEAVESGAKSEIIIARNGKPAAKLVPLGQAPVGRRIGLLEGKYKAPKDFDTDNAAVSKLFGTRR